MNVTEIKKALYKEKPIARQVAIYRDGGSTDYMATTSLGNVMFHVPIMDQRGSDGKILPEFLGREIPAQLLIRWLKTDEL